MGHAEPNPLALLGLPEFGLRVGLQALDAEVSKGLPAVGLRVGLQELAAKVSKVSKGLLALALVSPKPLGHRNFYRDV